MNNPFNKAFEAVVDAKQDRLRTFRTQEEKEAEKRAFLRSFTEPLLRSVAPAAQSKLKSLRVQPITVKAPQPHELPWPAPRRFWPLGVFFNSEGGLQFSGGALSLTEDGYFTKNPRLSGPEGFEDLLAETYLIAQYPKEGDFFYASPLCVEEGTHRVCIALKDYDLVRVYGFTEYVADQVRKLGIAARTGNGVLWREEWP